LASHELRSAVQRQSGREREAPGRVYRLSNLVGQPPGSTALVNFLRPSMQPEFSSPGSRFSKHRRSCPPPGTISPQYFFASFAQAARLAGTPASEIGCVPKGALIVLSEACAPGAGGMTDGLSTPLPLVTDGNIAQTSAKLTHPPIAPPMTPLIAPMVARRQSSFVIPSVI